MWNLKGLKGFERSQSNQYNIRLQQWSIGFWMIAFFFPLLFCLKVHFWTNSAVFAFEGPNLFVFWKSFEFPEIVIFKELFSRFVDECLQYK